ncbi:MAG: hypothetical protein GQ574_14930 [Crocinitomix sp.]|nr:hypothetical protein [Crocinitomix sp.]
MKNTHYIIAGLVLISFACKKPEVVPPPAPDAAALIAFNSENIEEATQYFSVDANSPIFIYGEKGTSLYLGADALVDASGDLVTGDVQVELIEIDKKSEMILMNKATMGKIGSNHATLVSQGEFYVSISQYGTELVLTSPMSLMTPVDEYDPNMRKFVNISDEEDLLWEIADDSLLEVGEDSVGIGMLYDILPGEWGWTNIDKFYSDPRPKTDIFAELPEGFDETNTEVYISYDGESNALAQFDVWTGTRFTEHYGLIPIGLEVHFVAIGIVGDELHYYIEPATITDNHVQDIDDFTAITEDALVTLLDALP